MCNAQWKSVGCSIRVMTILIIRVMTILIIEHIDFTQVAANLFIIHAANVTFVSPILCK